MVRDCVSVQIWEEKDVMQPKPLNYGRGFLFPADLRLETGFGYPYNTSIGRNGCFYHLLHQVHLTRNSEFLKPSVFPHRGFLSLII